MGRFRSTRYAAAALAVVVLGAPGGMVSQAAAAAVFVNGQLGSGNTASSDTYEVTCPQRVSTVVINIRDTGTADPLLLSCSGTSPTQMVAATRVAPVPALGVNNCQPVRPQKLGDGQIKMLAAV